MALSNDIFTIIQLIVALPCLTFEEFYLSQKKSISNQVVKEMLFVIKWRQYCQIIIFQMVILHIPIKEFHGRFQMIDGKLQIELKSKTKDYLLKNLIGNDMLPSSCINIFDTVTDLFNYISESSRDLDVNDNALIIRVQTIRMREIRIELQQILISKEEKMERRIEGIEKKTEALGSFIESTLAKQMQKALDEYSRKIVKPIADDLKKVSEKLAALERSERMMSNPQIRKWATNSTSVPIQNKTLIPQKAVEVEKLIAQPVEKQPSSELLSEAKAIAPQKSKAKSIVPEKSEAKTIAPQNSGAKQKSEVRQSVLQPPLQSPLQPPLLSGTNPLNPLNRLLGQSKVSEFIFDIDQANRYLQFYKIDQNTIIRRRNNDEIYMLYASNPIPSTGRHSIRFRINKITDGFIWFGLLSQPKKTDQYIGEEKGIIQYCLQGTQVLLDGRTFPINFPAFKAGQMMRMEVQLTSRKLRFYRNSHSNVLLKLTIPESMCGSKLFPYVQMINEGDSITFL